MLPYEPCMISICGLTSSFSSSVLMTSYSGDRSSSRSLQVLSATSSQQEALSSSMLALTMVLTDSDAVEAEGSEVGGAAAACWMPRLTFHPQRLYPAGAALPSLRQYLPRNEAIRRLASGVSRGQELCSVKQEVTRPFSPFDQHETFSVMAAIRLKPGVSRSKLVSCPTKSYWFNWRQLDFSCWTIQLSSFKHFNVLGDWEYTEDRSCQK